jgi:CBS domain containing-hemolysin-like protein
VRVEELANVVVTDAMQPEVVTVDAETTVRAFLDHVAAERVPHTVYPVIEGGQVVGTIAVNTLSRLPTERWTSVRIGELADRTVTRVPPGGSVELALRLLRAPGAPHLVCVMDEGGPLEGIVTKSDVLAMLDAREHGHG